MKLLTATAAIGALCLIAGILVGTSVRSDAASGRGAAGQAAGGQQPGRGAPGPFAGGNPLSTKRPDLPANLFTAGSTVASTPLRHEWVDIPLGKGPLGSGKLHTWIEYPQGADKAAIVIVMHHAPGLDDLERAVADQLSREGFIAVAPDLLSGLGPHGGNFDSFAFPDDAIRANGKLTAEEALRRYQVARDYALRLPQANGKSASVGFDTGGAYSFRFAAEAPELNAAVVFYGMPPDDATMAKIKAPVLGLYGGDDARVNATIEATAAAMKRLGKIYEPHIYPHATHFFMVYQVEGENGAAVAQAWPAAIAFLKQNTK